MKHKLTIVTLFLLLTLTPTVSAQELELSATPEISPTAAPVDYQLPYPGVLPGHFLYTLKDMRDNVMSFMISSPVKKAEFDILQADKRYQAAFLLVERDKENVEVAKQTLAKAQDYFAEAIEKTNAAKKQGLYNSDLVKKLSLSQQKHKEVLGAIEDKLGKEGKSVFADAEKREIEFEKKIKQITP